MPLIVAGLGVVGTLTAGIAGGLITQRWADRRDEKTWTRERAREQERWRREDEARTFEHRREIIENFYEALKALVSIIYDHSSGLIDNPELPEDWPADAYAKLTRLSLYADRRVAAAAETAYEAACSWGNNTKYNDPDDPEFYERKQRYDDAEFKLLVLIREALSIPEADLTLPLPGYTHDAPRPDTSDDQEESSPASETPT